MFRVQHEDAKGVSFYANVVTVGWLKQKDGDSEPGITVIQPGVANRITDGTVILVDEAGDVLCSWELKGGLATKVNGTMHASPLGRGKRRK